MTCTFFGHKGTPNEIEPVLRSILIDLIEEKGVNLFYVGNNGNFDFMVRKNLRELKSLYPHIDYSVILAYIPGKKNEDWFEDYSDTLYPDAWANTPPKYAISKRNKWMMDNSHIVVTYVRHSTGGAAQFKKLAEKKGKTVVKI